MMEKNPHVILLEKRDDEHNGFVLSRVEGVAMLHTQFEGKWTCLSGSGRYSICDTHKTVITHDSIVSDYELAVIIHKHHQQQKE